MERPVGTLAVAIVLSVLALSMVIDSTVSAYIGTSPLGPVSPPDLVWDACAGGTVFNLSWSPDGSLLAVAASGNVALLDSGGEVLWMQRVDGGASLLSWSPDGTMIAVGSDLFINNNSVRIYVFTREGVLAWSDAVDQISLGDLQWSPDGSKLAFIGNDMLYVYDANGTLLWHTDAAVFSGFSWSPDGEYIVYGQGLLGFKLVVSRANTGELVAETPFLQRHYLWGVSWNPNGYPIVAVYASGWYRNYNLTVAAYNLSGGNLTLIWARSQTVSEIWKAMARWNPQGTLVAVLGYSLISLYRSDGELLWSNTSFQHYAATIAWSPDGGRLAVESGGDQVYIFDTNGDVVAHRMVGGFVLHIDWNPANNVIATASGDRVYLLDSTSLSVLEYRARISRGDAIIAWSPDGRFIAAGWMYSLDVYLLDGTSVASEDGLPGWVSDIKWSPDSRLLLTVYRHGVQVYTMAAGREALELSPAWGIWEPNETVEHVSWNPVDSTLAIAFSDDGQSYIVVYEPRTGEIIWNTTRLNGSIEWMAWSPRGDRIAFTIFYQGDTALVLGGPGVEPYTIPLSGHDVVVEWSPTGDYLAVGSTVELAGFRTGKLKVYNDHGSLVFQSVSTLGGGVTAVAWSPDGERLVVATDEAGDDRLPGRMLVAYTMNGDIMFEERFDVPVWLVSWDPRGELILVMADKMYVLESDGELFWTRNLPTPDSTFPSRKPRASWSTSGSLIGYTYTGMVEIYTRDGLLFWNTTIPGFTGPPPIWNPVSDYFALTGWTVGLAVYRYYETAELVITGEPETTVYLEGPGGTYNSTIPGSGNITLYVSPGYYTIRYKPPIPQNEIIGELDKLEDQISILAPLGSPAEARLKSGDEILGEITIQAPPGVPVNGSVTWLEDTVFFNITPGSSISYWATPGTYTVIVPSLGFVETVELGPGEHVYLRIPSPAGPPKVHETDHGSQYDQTGGSSSNVAEGGGNWFSPGKLALLSVLAIPLIAGVYVYLRKRMRGGLERG